LFLLFYSSFSLIWTPNLINGIQDVIYLLLGVLIIFIIISSKISTEDFLKYLIIFFLVNLLVSVGESLDIFRYPVSRYSPFSQFFGIPYVGEENGRTIPTGFLVNENNNAFFILIFTPIVIKSIKPIFVLPLLIICSFVVFMASSKLVLLAWGALLTILLIVLGLKRWGSFKTSLMFLFLGVVFIIFFMFSKQSRLEKYSRTIPAIKSFVTQAPSNFIQRLKGENVKFDFSKFDPSLHERLTYVDGVAKVISDNWILGFGAGSINDIVVEQGPSRLILRFPHFYFLEIFAKYGLIYLAVYIFWLIKLLHKSFRIHLFYFLSLASFMLFSPVIASAIYFIPKWSLYALLIKVSHSRSLEE
jgi:hypothetical protein